MLGVEVMLETLPPSWLFPERRVPTSTVLPDTYIAQQDRQDEPINVGALQAGQVETAVKNTASSVMNTARSVTDALSGIAGWIQSAGGTIVFIAVLGLGAWALSSVAAIRRR